MASTDWAVVLKADGCRLQPDASIEEIRAVETALGVALPIDLASLYRTSDGVFDEPGQWFVIWPIEEVLARNRAAWEIDVPERRELVGFADDGTGAPFCVRGNGEEHVVGWSPIDGAGRVVAQTVAEFWSGWTSGTLVN
ncbi:SMI1/KNR4 family protein [Antrihabitans sp. NCIMB 15449]|uniref:SMI1/KNR4 family protein n=1 Tax=Antrihabitans spumae TaxID=3373370 RepID=A0ABW7JSH8_9NOCA